MGFFKKIFGKQVDLGEQMPIYFASNEEDYMQRAFEQARESFRYFWRELYWERHRVVPGLDFAMVKICFLDALNGEEVGEHMWINDVDFDGETISGTLVNEPDAVKNVKNGDRVNAKIDEMSDWMFAVGGRAYGGFSVQAMRSRMQKGELKEHDKAWGLDFGDFKNNHIDLFGDAYEFLISNYAANAGKSGGEFFTPQNVSKLIAALAMYGQERVNKIYDPACGSGSLLLQAKKRFDKHEVEDGFFGQEINHTTYTLARMNMFLHNVNYSKFHIELGDTLLDPKLSDNRPFDAIVSNPPYSINWIGSDNPTLINDSRFAPAGVLAPKSKADFAFILHALSYLSTKGRAAIVSFPGIFYRGGAEKKIREYLVKENFVETVIALAPNLFYGTSIAVNILVLSKHKTETKTQFIDAGGFFEKRTNNNVLTDGHISKIIDLFDKKEDVAHVCVLVDNEKIAQNDYNLAVSSYVEAKDTREDIDINELNLQIKQTVAKISNLREKIDETVAQINLGGENE